MLSVIIRGCRKIAGFYKIMFRYDGCCNNILWNRRILRRLFTVTGARICRGEQGKVFPARFRKSVYLQLNAPLPFGGLDNHGYRQTAVPFKGVRFAGGLTDKGLPVHICLYMRVTVSISHPADYGVRIDGDGIAGLYVAEGDWVSVREDVDIGVIAFTGECRSFQSLLRDDA